MRLNRVVLEQFRSYESAELLVDPGLTVVTGPNGSGKTNLLEAISATVTGHSPRAASDVELVRTGADHARVRLDLGDVDGRETARLELFLPGAGAPGELRKRIALNGVPRRSSTVGEVVRVVLFRPEEMLLLVGAPSERRRFLDGILAQRDRLAARALTDLARILAQRNALLRALRAEEADAEELRVWDAPLVEAGSRVMAARLRLVAELEENLGPLHRDLTPETPEPVRLVYLDSLKWHAGREPIADADRLAAAFRRRLEEVRQKEIWHGLSLVGPQRDDLRVELEGRDVALHASRGQQRTLILALKLAEAELLGSEGPAPIVLLDDIFSELDPERTAHALDLLRKAGQVLATTADVATLPARHRRAVPTWRVDEGRLIHAPRVA